MLINSFTITQRNGVALTLLSKFLRQGIQRGKGGLAGCPFRWWQQSRVPLTASSLNPSSIRSREERAITLDGPLFSLGAGVRTLVVF